MSDKSSRAPGRGGSARYTPGVADSVDGVETVASGPTGGAAAVHGRLNAGTALGRYLVLDLLGEGGMGQVYRGYDPKLRREVAIKVLNDDGGEASVARLVREAQAMAQLSHPNVVPVYDVEERQGRVFLAMELVEGQTLTEWLKEDRTVEQTLSLLIAAGRGLAAAHAVDLVHRDFKPGNVMVGQDGRARVVDFGIARGASEIEAGVSAAMKQVAESWDHSLDSLSAPLTRAGLVLGTPAYMAPEQHHGEAVDHRGDQYAFCVTVYHAISGNRPFRARPDVDLARVKAEEPPPPLPGVPRHVQRAIAKGLSPKPRDRFDSMSALLAELERLRGSSLRRFGVFGAMGLVLAGTWGFTAWSQAQREAACVEAASPIHELYNDQTRASIKTAIENTGLAYASTTAESTLRWLDQHAQQWGEAKQTSCRHSDVEGIWDSQTRARADWCLDGWRTRFSALTERLTVAEIIDVETASERAAGLPPASRCVDEQALVSLTVPPADARDALAATQQVLAHAAALIRSERLDEGLGLARQALAEAQDAAFLPVVARAHMAIADALDAQGEFADGSEARKLGYFAAMEAGSPHLAGAAATGLIFSTGVNLAREDEAQDWYRHAKIALGAAGAAEGDLALANAESNIASVDFYAAKVASATPRFEHVLAVREAVLGAEHPQVASVLNMLGSSIARAGDFAAGRVMFGRALQIQRSLYGEDHPSVATTLHNIATGLHVAGDFSAAAEIYEQSLAIRQRSLRPDHPDIGLSLNNLAGIAWELGDKRKSLEISQRALAILEGQYGPSHPRVANSLTGVAGTHVALDEAAQAVPLLERAVAIYDAHPRGAKSNEPTARFELAKVLAATGGDAQRARDEANKARRLYAELGDDGTEKLASIDEFLLSLRRVAAAAQVD